MSPQKSSLSKTREELILEVLSFYDSMTFAQILFELKEEDLKNDPEFTQDILRDILQSLEKRKILTKTDHNGEVSWQKQMPGKNRSFLSKLKAYLKFKK